ncbi:hypothetical protein [Pseudomonas sp.]|uniref:hypothetical protein n=1 Tax=Pseudomonas sp. TaxID=306 RepID=UPI0028AAA592|nr:hypothetical protein [Pseudomonas sp.]
MANTLVFPLGLGVTLINPLGHAIALLRRDVERLRRQAEGTRLGRLIGEVAHLGVALGKLDQVEQAADPERQPHEQTQVKPLREQLTQIERLRQHYQRLDRVIAGLAQLKPLHARLTVEVWRAYATSASAQAATATTTVAAAHAAAPAAVATQPAALPALLGRGAVAVAGLGLATYGVRRGARHVLERQPVATQRRMARVAGASWRTHRVDALGKAAKALLEGEDGQARAQGVGAAAGEIGGSVLGAALPLLSRNRFARRHGATLGAHLGEALGTRTARMLYGWVTAPVDVQPNPQGVPVDDVATAADAMPSAAPAPQRSATSTGAAAGVVAGALTVAGVAAYRKGQGLPRNTRRRLSKVTREQWQAHRVDTLGKVGKASITAEDGEERAQGVGAALGEMAGRLLGAALPRLTKSRAARKYGADVGAYLGEALGGLGGAGLFKLATAPASTPAPSQQDEQGAAEPGIASQAAPQARVAPPAVQQPAAESALAQEALALAGSVVPGAGGVLKRVPLAAVVGTSLEVLDTYDSDAPRAEKIERYASAGGGLSGSLAGAAAGAAIGSAVLPVIGTALGGIVGGVLGSMGGEAAGSWLGRAVAVHGGEPSAVTQQRSGTPTPALPIPVDSGRLPASSASATSTATPHASATATAITQADARAVGSAAAGTDALPAYAPALPASNQSLPTHPPTINQQFTFTANMPVTFNNSLDDPGTVQQLEATVRRVLDDLMRQARSVQMVDQPQP